MKLLEQGYKEEMTQMSRELNIKVELIDGKGSLVSSSDVDEMFINNCNVFINGLTSDEIVDLFSKTIFTNVIIKGDRI